MTSNKHHPGNIRTEADADCEPIAQIHRAAFDTQQEADLVDALRSSGTRCISLVYEEDGQLLGHILFTPVELVGDTSGLQIAGLAPMAVIPERQNQGIGSSLVTAGVQYCATEGYDAIVVLGHPNFYPRFGFVPSVKFGIESEYDVPDDVFMLLELTENGLSGKQGTIKYHAAFASVG